MTVAADEREDLQGGAYRAPVDVNLSVTDIFTIGIGPSSSHTVGPMRAAHRFVNALDADDRLQATARVTVDLFGSLALTGKGHATDIAILLGLSGERPSQVDPDAVAGIVAAIRDSQKIALNGRHEIRFVESRDLTFRYDEFLPEHSNGMTINAFDKAGEELFSESFFSVGGGYVVTKSERDRSESPRDNIALPFGFSSGDEMLEVGRKSKKTIAEMMMANEAAWRDEAETTGFLDAVHAAMADSIKRGCREKGILPGGLNVPRRARKLYLELKARPEAGFSDPMTVLDWVNLFALAVNEENAAGGRVVTAPTNGAAGVIPAVLTYYERFIPGANRAGIHTFLLTAAAIGTLYKKRASISAAEVGCQGEVGVACSMAAAGLTAVLGGSNAQIENAAEIGMEHNLGLTCDPIGGLVQIPCIERNTMGATKAINAARLALRGDGTHHVSLDKVIETMRQTGYDMQSKYKETSQGGLAVNVVEC